MSWALHASAWLFPAKMLGARLLAIASRAGDFATIDIIVLARSGIDKLDNPAVTAMLNSLFDKLCLKGAELTRTP